MNFKRAFIICAIVGIGSFAVAGILYITGGHELFKAQDSFRYTTKSKTIEKEEQIEGVQSIKVNIDIGNVEFKYIDDDILKLELTNPLEQSEQPIKIEKEGDILKIDVNDIDKKMNFHIGKGLKNVRESKLNISIPRKYKGNMDISSDIGNVEGKYSGKKLKLSSDIGNIDVEIDEIEYGEITTDIGNIKVKIKKESNLTLALKTELGTIKNNMKNIRNIDDKSDTKIKISQDIKFDVNQGGNIVNIKSDLGNIELHN